MELASGALSVEPDKGPMGLKSVTLKLHLWDTKRFVLCDRICILTHSPRAVAGTSKALQEFWRYVLEKCSGFNSD
jgi:hypothetical protein